jgi:hypothetical protein
MGRPACGLALAAALLVAGCGAKPRADGHRLELRADPPSPASLAPGRIIKITAAPVPGGDMQWVSGTVKVLGARVVAFRKDPEDGLYKFKTMVPPMVDIPSGSYQVKAWGRTLAGEDVEGSLDYEVR